MPVTNTNGHGFDESLQDMVPSGKRDGFVGGNEEGIGCLRPSKLRPRGGLLQSVLPAPWSCRARERECSELEVGSTGGEILLCARP